MRALLWVVLVFSALWTGYWFVGQRTIEAAVNQWFASQPAGVARNGGVSVEGIPNRFDLTVTAPEFHDPASGMGWKAPFVQVYAMTWKPWHVIAALPSGQEITLPDQTVSVASDKIMASVLVHPNTDLGLSELVGEAHAVVVSSNQGWTVAVAKALASVRADATPLNSYRLGLEVAEITPDAALMAALAGTDLPGKVEEIHLDAHVSLSAALDRHAGETHPYATGLDLAEARVTWGALKFSAKGKLEAGPDGLAVGEIALRVEGWRKLPPVLAALGLIAPGFAPTLERGLEVMAQEGGDPAVLVTALKCENGWMTLGPLPLGPAPQLNGGVSG